MFKPMFPRLAGFVLLMVSIEVLFFFHGAIRQEMFRFSALHWYLHGQNFRNKRLWLIWLEVLFDYSVLTGMLPSSEVSAEILRPVEKTPVEKYRLCSLNQVPYCPKKLLLKLKVVNFETQTFQQLQASVFHQSQNRNFFVCTELLASEIKCFLHCSWVLVFWKVHFVLFSRICCNMHLYHSMETYMFPIRVSLISFSLALNNLTEKKLDSVSGIRIVSPTVVNFAINFDLYRCPNSYFPINTSLL